MKLVKISGTFGLVALMSFASQFAQADKTGWYIGANVGQSRAEIDDQRIKQDLQRQGFTTTSISDNERDIGYKLFGGYQFNQYFALEGGYFDLGQFDFTANTFPTGTLNGDIRLRGLNVDAVGFLPFTERFSAFGRVGVNYADARDSFTGSGLVRVSDPNPKERAFNYKFGLGLQYELTQSLATRLEAERYRINDAVGNKGDIDLISIGLVYRFNQKSPIVYTPVREPEPTVTPVPLPAPVMPLPTKVTLSANSKFDFDKASVRPEDKREIDTFTSQLTGLEYETVQVTGHTDRIGTHEYNVDLSTRRADAVKGYIVGSTGIPSSKINAQGVDGAYPVTKLGECQGTKVTQRLINCLQPDRRVEIEVVGTK
ncbi:MAG: porin OmpA [Aquirhabdus sp.]